MTPRLCMLRGATFDSTGAYRYHLWREWDGSLPAITFVMLNPSTADAEHDDPTVRRCIGFARDWGFGRLEVMNLFACRATSRRALAAAHAPVGPHNERWLSRAATSEHLVLAWGNPPRSIDNPCAAPNAGLWHDGRASSWCLGRTKLGQPRHPLYVSAQTPRVRFPRPPSGPHSNSNG